MRECNAALKIWGDDRSRLLRALRLLGKMRKAATLQTVLLQQQQPATGPTKGGRRTSLVGNNNNWFVPAPTLVTYSTLMSRFVKANKPAVALRLWNLMTTHKENAISVIDVRAANILMNCFAKMADVTAAQELLEAMKNQQTKGHHPTNDRAATAYHNLKLPPPNTVTYNTFLSACHKAGDLDAAVAAVTDMVDHRRLPADAMTYTSLIATVARRPSQRAGARDPSPAFAFLQEMQNQGIPPNGMTYSALIDACGRCGRSDLALQGLRMMVRQKVQEQKVVEEEQSRRNSGSSSSGSALSSSVVDKSSAKNYTLANEVGAWTAAINACGKAGRLETAQKLFYKAMPSFGVKPNTVTCGCLTDSLLRYGRTAETLEVLRYMKEAGLPPSEVMYTSLMSRAGKLVEMERRTRLQLERGQSLHPRSDNLRLDTMDDCGEARTEKDTTCKAIRVYTELIQSLIDTTSRGVSSSVERNGKPQRHRKSFQRRDPPQDSKSLLLLKVFLVFQEMKNAGAEIDLPCYNTLLRACAQAGDYTRAQDVLAKMQADNLTPNDTTWRLLLRSASSSTDGTSRVERAEDVWRQGLWSHHRPSLSASPNQRRRTAMDEAATMWKPSVNSFRALLSVYVREAPAANTAASVANSTVQEGLLSQRQQNDTITTRSPSPALYYRRVVQLYEDVLMGRNEEMGMDRIDLNLLLESQTTMLVILQAIVALEAITAAAAATTSTTSTSGTAAAAAGLRSMAVAILQLECFRHHRHVSAQEALQTVRGWATAER